MSHNGDRTIVFVGDIEQIAFNILQGIPEDPSPPVPSTQNGTLMKPNLAVFTIDQVNFHYAASFAADLGANAQLVFPKDPYPSGTELADLYDLDYYVFSQKHREKLIHQLCDRHLSRPTALHSYNVSDHDQAALKANGVIVARSLSAALVRAVLLGQADEKEDAA